MRERTLDEDSDDGRYRRIVTGVPFVAVSRLPCRDHSIENGLPLLPSRNVRDVGNEGVDWPKGNARRSALGIGARVDRVLYGRPGHPPVVNYQRFRVQENVTNKP